MSGRPIGTGATFVRIEFHAQRSHTVHIGRRLWQDIGAPGRVQLRRDRERSAITFYLLPCVAPLGFAVTCPPAPGGGMPRLSLGHARALELGLMPGRFAAGISELAIMVDLSIHVER